MFFVPLYYNALIGGDWCSGSTRDSDPLSVGSIPISPAKKTHLHLQMCFLMKHIYDVRKMNSPSAMICTKDTLKPIALCLIRALRAFHFSFALRSNLRPHSTPHRAFNFSLSTKTFCRFLIFFKRVLTQSSFYYKMIAYS